MAAAISYAHHRTGDIAFAVRTDHRFYGFRPDHVEWSASVLKAMLLVAYLDLPSVAHRSLNGDDGSLLSPMITHSDNDAATTVDGIVGRRRAARTRQPGGDDPLRAGCGSLGREPDHRA